MIADILGVLADFAVGVWAARWLLAGIAVLCLVAYAADLRGHVDDLVAEREQALKRAAAAESHEADLRRMAATPAVVVVRDDGLPDWLVDWPNTPMTQRDGGAR